MAIYFQDYVYLFSGESTNLFENTVHFLAGKGLDVTVASYFKSDVYIVFTDIRYFMHCTASTWLRNSSLK